MKFHVLIYGLFLILSVECETPVVITTWGSDGFVEATKNAVLARNAGGRMFGLVSGLTACEALQCDTTVGFAGSPDESGETCLDALVIDSVGMRMGSVANLHRIRDAAKVAWAVMNYTKHTLLVGESATKFAKQMGFVEQDLSSDVTKKWITDWKENSCQPNFWQNVEPSASSSCGPYKPNLKLENFQTEAGFNVERENHDTIGMVVIDDQNKTAAGTSSNGARFKISGRVGDSPIPGAGAYANEYGGAASTGDGDVMMRFLPSFHVMQQIALGAKPAKAALKTIKIILNSYPKFQGGIVALDTKGRYGAACANIEKFSYTVGYRNGTTKPNKIRCITAGNKLF